MAKEGVPAIAEDGAVMTVDEESPEFAARQAAFFAKAQEKRARYQAGASEFHKKREQLSASLAAEFGQTVTVESMQEEHQRELDRVGAVEGTAAAATPEFAATVEAPTATDTLVQTTTVSMAPTPPCGGR